jgi:primosomal protein N' (replication factor Y)
VIAKVLVQTPVSSIEEIYDYIIPVEIQGQITFGTLVEIPFRNRLTIGLVTATEDQDRLSRSNSSGLTLKEIKRYLSQHPVIDQVTFELIKATQRRYGGSLWQILSQAIPNAVSKPKHISESNLTRSRMLGDAARQELVNQIGETDLKTLEKSANINWAIIPPNGQAPLNFIANLVLARAQIDQVLVLVPDEKELDALAEILAPILKNQLVSLNSTLSRTERFSNHLQVITGSARVVIGTRSATFAPVSESSTVLVYDELDESFWEKHSPGWNSRDVTLLRKRNSKIFISTSFSLELMQQIEDRNLQFRNYANLKQLKWISYDQNRSFHEVVRSGLKLGPVLISIAEKGYANMFVCSKCRNRATCDCGGKLIIPNQKSAPTCVLCNKNFLEWKCIFCEGHQPYVLRKGADRTLEEIGRIFPKFKIYLSTGTKRIDKISAEPQIVIATPGSEPIGTYAAVVLLDGELQFNRPQLRGEEVARLRWRKIVWQTKAPGSVYLSLSNHHSFVQDIYSANESRYFKREIQSRKSAKLPPEFRTATISGPTKELSTFAANLRQQSKYLISDVRSRNVSKSHTDILESSFVIRFRQAESDSVIQLLQEVNQVRLLKKKTAFSIMIDAYDLF